MKGRKVRLFLGEDRQWYFIVIGDNGETIMLSEGYKRADDPHDTIETYLKGWTVVDVDDNSIVRGV